MADLSEVCEELDKTLLELMGYLRELSSLRNKYRDEVKEGYFAMSQARHAMGGPMCVSPLQYDAGMKSLAQVNLETDLSMGDAEECSSYDQLLSVARTKDKVHMEFKVQRIKPGVVCRPKSSSEDEGTEGGALRRRKGEEGIEEVTSEVVGEVKDPIRWFGILVPQTLRRSQQCFVQAVNHCVEMASAQMRTELARRKYQELLERKKKLVERSINS